ncbi:MAG: hypothetical protein RDV48_19975 [Candidatus Eremiobacteraeota bacterium]|nr:hypothetical protein [Candidatus Eremiobacteraeota bacterium]
MADYADHGEIELIERKYANYPSLTEIRHMCHELGIVENDFRTIKEEDAWAYYHELKAMIEAKQRKTA